MAWATVRKPQSVGFSAGRIAGYPLKYTAENTSHLKAAHIHTIEKPDLETMRMAFAHSCRKIGCDLSATVDRLAGKKPLADFHRKVNGVPLDWKADVPTEQLKELRNKVTVIVEHKDENGHVDGMLIIPNGANLKQDNHNE